jgi:ribosome-binding protein aMBF1 (putative translation factor)
VKGCKNIDSIFDNAKIAEDDIFSSLSTYQKKEADIKGHISALITNKRNSMHLSQRELAILLKIPLRKVKKYEACDFDSIKDIIEILVKLNINFELKYKGEKNNESF